MKRMYVRTKSALVALAISVGAACASEEPVGDAGVVGPGLEDDDAAAVCAPTTPEFATGAMGLTAMNESRNLKVRLDEANWSPPAKDYNTWQVVLTDLAGEPLPQAQVTWACSWMPAHGHGVNPKAIEKQSDGRISLVKMNMAMNGGWDIRLWVDTTGTGRPFAGGTDSRSPNACSAPAGGNHDIEFKVCVPRNRGVN